MSAAEILKQFKGQISSLPATFRKNMMDMHDADAKVNRLLAEINRDSEKLMREKKLNNEQARRMVYNRCKEKFEEIKRLADEKCRIASDNYELIDKHVIKLDNEMNKLRPKQDDGDQKSRKRKSTRDAAEKEPSRKKKKKDQEDLPQEAIPVVDMPVDPNEPTYCLCHQVSFGEMVGCDNKDCPIEWFHFQCVGLTAKPRGKWFCPRCYPLIRKRKQSSNRKSEG